MSSKSCDDDDFAALFLMMSGRTPLLSSLISETRLRDFMSSLEKRLRYRRIPRCALVDTRQSSFQRLLLSRNDQAFITFTGLDFSNFQYLLNKFTPLYNRYSPYSQSGKITVIRDRVVKKGRPRSLGPADCLGLVLGYTRTKGSLFALQMVFGASHSVLSLFLKYSTRLLFRVLQEEEDARVALPSPEEVAEYQAVVETNYPALQGVWCVMDGLKIKIEKSSDEETQNAYYNGWLHSHFVGCVYVFVPSGVVVASAVNAPGSWHDSEIATNCGLYDKLQSIFDSSGGKAVVDSAFSKKRCPFMIKSGKRKPGETARRTVIRQQATSLRQCAEWGMRAIQGSFPRLKDKLLFSESLENRKVFLNLITMLLNFRTRRIGFNQLMSTYYPRFEAVGDDAIDYIN
jgi:hypothetical protein